MFATERQAEIAELVATSRRVNGAELARRFDVTMETVRRDLAALEAAGRLRRVHGGAVPVEQTTVDEKAIHSRQHLNTPEKRRIAEAAFSLLRTSGAGAVVLDAGSTVEALADLIVRSDSTLPDGQEQLIITHALHIAAKLADATGIGLELVGGRVRKLTWAAAGGRAAEHYSRLRPDVAFIGCNGLHPEFGLSTPDPIEAVVKSAIVQTSRRVVLLCDAAKFGQETLMRFASLEEIDTLVTDRAPVPELAAALEAADVEVVLA